MQQTDTFTFLATMAATVLLSLAVSQPTMAAPVQQQRANTVRLLSAHTGLYVQSLPDLSANAGDLMDDQSTKFVVEFSSDGRLRFRRFSDRSQFLSLQEREDSGVVTYTESEEINGGSGLSPLLISHTEFEYHYEPTVFSTVLRVRHSNGRYCYLAFEENGNLVKDPCAESIDLYQARLMLVAFRE